jgi:hypothetical protein
MQSFYAIQNQILSMMFLGICSGLLVVSAYVLDECLKSRKEFRELGE